AYALQQPAWLTLLLEQVRPEMPRFELADTFRLASLPAILLGCHALTLSPTPPQREARDRFAPLAALRLLRRRDFALFFACHFALSLTLPFASQNTPLLLDELGIDDAWKGPALTLGQLVEVGSMALLPWLLARGGQRRVMLLGAGAWALVLAVQARGHPASLVVSCLALNWLYI